MAAYTWISYMFVVCMYVCVCARWSRYYLYSVFACAHIEKYKLRTRNWISSLRQQKNTKIISSQINVKSPQKFTISINSYNNYRFRFEICALKEIFVMYKDRFHDTFYMYFSKDFLLLFNIIQLMADSMFKYMPNESSW